jgi:DNA-binding transcriptional MerR regulator
MAEKIELPEDQEFFKLNEVCKLANVQPYMLRFWGTEFEALETTTTETGQRLYSRPQMALILEIRRLLFDEGLTIAGARREIDKLVEAGTLDLAEEPAEIPAPAKKKAATPKRKKAAAKPKAAKKAAPEPQPEPEVDKATQADVQPLLAALEEVRKELTDVVAELKSRS